MDKTYICIDLKSFYASVECVERGLDPMEAKLVVADPERSDKTICLAVSPALKKLGVKNRCRVFEIPKNIDYITAPPRMQKYIDYAAEIYGVYLKYFAPDDVYVYSIDEVFIDATLYLPKLKMTDEEAAVFLMEEVRKNVGVRATAGIGTNLYLAKIALDITAKHSPSFIGKLTEESFIETLWDHQPLSDFWRIGKGTERRLKRFGICTMRQIANAPEELLYKEFGIDAELMIDHAWGRESVTLKDIFQYKPKKNSICSGQVLMRDYSAKEGEIILKEMADDIALTLVNKSLKSSVFSLTVGYSKTSGGEYVSSSFSLYSATSDDSTIREAYLKHYSEIIDYHQKIRRMMLTASSLESNSDPAQLSLFSDEEDKRKQKLQKAVLSIKDSFGKNAILKGMDLEEAATQKERNNQIGGHKK